MQREEPTGTKNLRKRDAKNLTNHAKIDPKGDPKSSKMRIRRGLRGSGGRSGSHVGPQGRPEAITCPKTTFEVLPGPPIWEVIFGTFGDFSVFCFHCFLRVVLEGFWERFGVDFGTIFEEILCVGRCNFGCGASLAKCHLDSLFTILEACRRFRKQWKQMQNLRNLRPISARSGRRGF